MRCCQLLPHRARYAVRVVILSDLTPEEAAGFVAAATLRHPALDLVTQVRGDVVDVVASESEVAAYADVFEALVAQALPLRLRRAQCATALRATIVEGALPAIGDALEALVRHLEGGASSDGFEVHQVETRLDAIELRGRCWWLDRGPEPFVATITGAGGQLVTQAVVFDW